MQVTDLLSYIEVMKGVSTHTKTLQHKQRMIKKVTSVLDKWRLKTGLIKFINSIKSGK